MSQPEQSLSGMPTENASQRRAIALQMAIGTDLGPSTRITLLTPEERAAQYVTVAKAYDDWIEFGRE
jgi:hypothetical protein